MTTRLNRRGFATWELALVVLIAAAIAFAGYHVYRSHSTTPKSTANSSQSSTNNSTSGSSSVSVPSAPTISNTSDLDSATAALNQTDPSSSNASDSSQLNSQANF